MSHWRERAVCATHPEPEMWFPDRSDDQTARLAVQWCQACPVIKACRREALDNPEHAGHGVWGGLTELDRYKMRGGARRLVGRSFGGRGTGTGRK